VTGAFNLLNNNKNNPIDNIICIINGIFHGISRRLKLENSDTMRGELMQSGYFVGAVQVRVLDRGWRYCGL